MSDRASFSERISNFGDKYNNETAVGAGAVAVAGVVTCIATRSAISLEDLQFGAGLCMVGGASGFLYQNLKGRSTGKFEVGNNSRVLRRLSASAAIGGAFLLAIASGGIASRGEGEQSPRPPSAEGVAASTSTTDLEGTAPVLGECEIPVDLTQANDEQKSRFERYLIDQGFMEGSEDGIINDQESAAVDRLQEAQLLDVSQRWNLDTCLVTPFGDGDTATP